MAKGFKHGYSKHPLYNTWNHMWRRCHVSTDPTFSYYGGKGVTVCEEWRNDRVAFIEWGISNGWEPGLELDKDILCAQRGITPSTYSPDTCQFISKASNAKETFHRKTSRRKDLILTEQMVVEIKDLYSHKLFNQRELAEIYGTTQSHVSKLINNKY